MQLPYEPEAYGEAMATILKRLYPNSTIELVSPLAMLMNGRYLDMEDFYRAGRIAPALNTNEYIEERLSFIVTRERAVKPPFPWSVAEEKIRPMIRSDSFFEHHGRESVVHIPFENNTVIAFVIDMPDRAFDVSVDDIIRWGVPIEQVEKTARENLREHSPNFEMKVGNGPPGFEGKSLFINVNDGYDAARMLMPRFYEKMATHLGGNFLVVTPSQDSLLAFTQQSTNFVLRIVEEAKQKYRILPKPLCEKPFLVTCDGIVGTP